MDRIDHLNRLKRRVLSGTSAQTVRVPDDYKVTSTEKRSAELVVAALRADGKMIPEEIRATATAPLKGRDLSAEDRLAEVENALSCVRADAGECSNESEKRGLLRAHEIVRCALAGEL